MAKKSKLLEELGKNMKDIKFELETELKELDIEVLNDITVHMRDVTDYRSDISYHPLENIIMITFLAIMGNSNEWTEIYEFGVIHQKWFSKFLNLEYGIPSVSTIRKTMALVDPEELEEVCVNFVINKIKQLTELFKSDENNENPSKDIIAYDEKVYRSSKRDNTINGEVLPVNAMIAFNVTKDISLATKFIGEKLMRYQLALN